MNPQDIIQYLRLKNIFEPDTNPDTTGASGLMSGDFQIPGGANSPPAVPAANSASATSPLDSYRPRTAISDAYQKLLMTPPTDQPVSKMRKFAGILSGALTAGTSDDVGAGITAGKYVTDYPNEKSKRDYKERLDQLGKGSTEENQQNINTRMLAIASGSQGLKSKQIDISKQRADAYAWHQTHPTGVIKEDSDGNLISIDPNSGTATYVTDTDGNQIASSTLTDHDKLIMTGQQKLEQIGAKSAADIKLEGVKEGNRETLAGVVGGENRDTKATIPGKAPITSGADDKVKQYVRARQALIEHPDWSKFIHLDTDGPNTLKVDPPSVPGKYYGTTEGPDEATHKAIGDYIMSGEEPVISSNKPSTELTDPKTGHKYDTSTWSAKDITEAKKRGFQ